MLIDYYDTSNFEVQQITAVINEFNDFPDIVTFQIEGCVVVLSTNETAQTFVASWMDFHKIKAKTFNN